MSRGTAIVAAVALLLTALPAAQSWPTPGANLGPRIVPEPLETNDYISYPEARGMLERLAAEYPDYIEVVETGDSVGWDNALTGARDTFRVFAVEVTHEASAMPREQKQVVLFQLSIHGNEKGGREGGLRVIEDLVAPRLYGEEYRALLDTTLVLFTFPNVDGWNHEELPYRTNCNPNGGGFVQLPAGCAESNSFIRGNGNFLDMNRDWPTLGWYETRFGREHALSEPEIAGLEAYLTGFIGRVRSATDIHGMLTPADGGVNAGADVPFPLNFLLSNGANGAKAHCFPSNPLGLECVREGHFVLGMLGGAQSDPLDNARSVRLAELSKEYLNAMAQEQFPYWTSLPNAAAAGGQWAEWGTGWDTIGYTDSGFTGSFFTQRLGAAGLDYELSYNHITFDNHYVPELNRMHVESVRAIVRAFLDEAKEPVGIALSPAGTIAYLGDDRVVSSAGAARLDGPHAAAASDDAYERPYEVSPQHFWRDFARHLPAGTLSRVTAQDLAQGSFHQHGTLVVAGDAWDLVAQSPDALRHLRTYLEEGKRLVLTDSALRGLEALELVPSGSVESHIVYLGYVDLDLSNPLAEGIRGLARQTYDAVPLGFAVPNTGQDEFTAPAWTVKSEAVQGQVAGTTGGAELASLGVVEAGAGEVVFIGALLPTPTQDDYHPYGLASYAVTYTGYQLLYNALGIEAREVPQGEALAPSEAPGAQRVPAPEAPLALAALGVLALAARRRRA